jgi:DNA-binding CsgD family transcriptional regulator
MGGMLSVAHGWSLRRIARELGVNRETVGKYLLLARSKPAISTPGSVAAHLNLYQPRHPLESAQKAR